MGVARYGAVLAGELAWITWGTLALTVLPPLALLVPGVAEVVVRLLHRRLSPDAGGLGRFLEALRAQVGRGLVVTIPLTVATLLINYLQGWLIARSLGLAIGFFDVTCLIPIASLLGLLPISLSGVGVPQLFFSLAFPLLRYCAAHGVSFGLLGFPGISLPSCLSPS